MTQILIKYQLLSLFCGFALYNLSADAIALKHDSASSISKSLEEKDKSNSPGRDWNGKNKDNFILKNKEQFKRTVKDKDYWEKFEKNITDYWAKWEKNTTEYWENWSKNLTDNLNKKDKDNNNKDKKIEFICPKASGLFPDIQNCNAYYKCSNKIAYKRNCNPNRYFDKFRKSCLPKPIAVCDNEEETTKATTYSDIRTSKIDGFVCPSMQGRYPHPEDCSKFFRCSNFVASPKTCPEQKLFDGAQMRCRREDKVNCGSREKHTTPFVTTTLEVSTEKSTTIILTTTPQHITEELTTMPSTTEDTTVQSTITTEEPTTFQPTTTEKPKPTGPPETNCPKEDLDCIIKETGEVSEWFKCSEAIGSFPHPSSPRLFVFCRNGKPQVKKCGQNRIFVIVKRNCVPV